MTSIEEDLRDKIEKLEAELQQARRIIRRLVEADNSDNGQELDDAIDFLAKE